MSIVWHFLKLFNKCSLDHSSFKPGELLFAVVTDWSDAEVHGLCEAVGEQVGQSMVHGAVYIGTAHGSEHVTEFHVPRTRIWKIHIYQSDIEIVNG